MAVSKKISPNKKSIGIIKDDAYFMRQALTVAKRAAARGEVPIAAVVVMDGKVFAAAANSREHHRDPTAHAEISAIRKACKKIGDWRLTGATLYVTMEPCLMCYGAIVQTRIGRIVFACENNKNPSYLRQIYNEWPKGPDIQGAVEEKQAATLLADFFKQLR